MLVFLDDSLVFSEDMPQPDTATAPIIAQAFNMIDVEILKLAPVFVVARAVVSRVAVIRIARSSGRPENAARLSIPKARLPRPLVDFPIKLYHLFQSSAKLLHRQWLVESRNG